MRSPVATLGLGAVAELTALGLEPRFDLAPQLPGCVTVVDLIHDAAPHQGRQLPDLVLRPHAQPQRADVRQLAEVGREDEVGRDALGIDVPDVLVGHSAGHHRGDGMVEALVQTPQGILQLEIVFGGLADAAGEDHISIGHVHVPLRLDRQRDVPVTAQLGQADAGDAFDGEAECHVFQERIVTALEGVDEAPGLWLRRHPHGDTDGRSEHGDIEAVHAEEPYVHAPASMTFHSSASSSQTTGMMSMARPVSGSAKCLHPRMSPANLFA